MADLRKIKDEAAQAFSKGKWPKAVELYDQVVKGDPKDLQAAMKLGDALVKSGNKGKAVLTYQRLAETYASQGFLPKAIAVCKVILEIDKEHNATQQILAGLYAKKTGNDGPAPAAKPHSGAMPAVKPAAKPPSVPVATPKPAAAAAPSPGVSDVELGDEIEVSADDAPLELDSSDHSGGLGSLDPVVEAGQPPAPVHHAPRPAVLVPPPPAQETPRPPPPEEPIDLGPALIKPAAKPPPPPRPPPEEPIDLGPELVKPAASAAPPPPPPRPMVAASPPPPPPPAPVVKAVEIPIEIDTPLELDIELSPAGEALVNPPAPTRPGSSAEVKIDDPALDAASEAEGEPEVVEPAPARPASAWGADSSAEISWDESAGTSIEAQLEQAVAQQAAAEGPTPLATPAEATSGEEDTSVEVAFDVPMADSAEEEIEVLSVTAELQKNAGRELPKIPLFSDLDPAAFVELTEQCGFIRAEPGQKIIGEGDAGNSFFVMCSGKMRVTKHSDSQDLVMAHLTEGAFFGEMALLSGAKRAATVIAEEESELLEISAPVLNGLARRFPHVASSLRSFGRQRLLSNVMATSALFRPFDKPDRKRLVELFKVREIKANEQVVEEGARTDGLYLVMSGELDVVRGSSHQVLATLSDGDIFGEMSLLSKKPATATVSAKRRSTVLRLPRERFEELIVTYPQVLMLVSDLADSRTRANAQTMATSLATDSGQPLV